MDREEARKKGRRKRTEEKGNIEKEKDILNTEEDKENYMQKFKEEENMSDSDIKIIYDLEDSCDKPNEDNTTERETERYDRKMVGILYKEELLK